MQHLVQAVYSNHSTPSTYLKLFTMPTRLRSPLFYALFLVMLSWCKLGAAEPSESVLILKIYSSRVLTPHLMLGYDRSSMRTLAQRITTDDVPTLMKMFQDPERENRSDVGFAIASQCQAGLDGLRKMVDTADAKDRINPQRSPTHVPYETRLAATKIAAFEDCNADTRRNAQSFVEQLDSRLKASAARSVERHKRERRAQNQHNQEVLESYANGTIRTLPRPTGSTEPNKQQ